jgi:hypothetical protein
MMLDIRSNSAIHNMRLTCSCGVDIVTELAEGHQLAHARKKGMKKNFQSFPFRWRVWQLVSEIYIFYFGYLSSRQPVCSAKGRIFNNMLYVRYIDLTKGQAYS